MKNTKNEQTLGEKNTEFVAINVFCVL